MYVITHRNILEMIDGVGEKLTDERSVERGLRVWTRIVHLFTEYGFPAHADIEGLHLLGGVYTLDGDPVAEVYADKRPEIPRVPSILVLRVCGKVYVMRVDRRVYIKLLKLLARASKVAAHPDKIPLCPLANINTPH